VITVTCVRVRNIDCRYGTAWFLSLMGTFNEECFFARNALYADKQNMQRQIANQQICWWRSFKACCSIHSSSDRRSSIPWRTMMRRTTLTCVDQEIKMQESKRYSWQSDTSISKDTIRELHTRRTAVCCCSKSWFVGIVAASKAKACRPRTTHI
jgi:hypothetical protein